MTCSFGAYALPCGHWIQVVDQWVALAMDEVPTLSRRAIETRQVKVGRETTQMQKETDSNIRQRW